ncbi:hypothetical protein EJ08DRAFT_575340, partial [Tothia fuscella]
LPIPSRDPRHYPDCCLGLSTQFITKITELLPATGLILSIGSGTGLLEAYLLEPNPSMMIEGVEVSAHVNRYLPADRMNVVAGTWDLCSRAVEATALLFVYPREGALIERYLSIPKLKAKIVLWIGPCNDWPD